MHTQGSQAGEAGTQGSDLLVTPALCSMLTAPREPAPALAEPAPPQPDPAEEEDEVRAAVPGFALSVCCCCQAWHGATDVGKLACWLHTHTAIWFVCLPQHMLHEVRH